MAAENKAMQGPHLATLNKLVDELENAIRYHERRSLNPLYGNKTLEEFDEDVKARKQALEDYVTVLGPSQEP